MAHVKLEDFVPTDKSIFLGGSVEGAQYEILFTATEIKQNLETRIILQLH